MSGGSVRDAAVAAVGRPEGLSAEVVDRLCRAAAATFGTIKGSAAEEAALGLADAYHPGRGGEAARDVLPEAAARAARTLAGVLLRAAHEAELEQPVAGAIAGYTWLGEARGLLEAARDGGGGGSPLRGGSPLCAESVVGDASLAAAADKAAAKARVELLNRLAADLAKAAGGGGGAGRAPAGGTRRLLRALAIDHAAAVATLAEARALVASLRNTRGVVRAVLGGEPALWARLAMALDQDTLAAAAEVLEKEWRALGVPVGQVALALAIAAALAAPGADDESMFDAPARRTDDIVCQPLSELIGAPVAGASAAWGRWALVALAARGGAKLVESRVGEALSDGLRAASRGMKWPQQLRLRLVDRLDGLPADAMPPAWATLLSRIDYAAAVVGVSAPANTIGIISPLWFVPPSNQPPREQAGGGADAAGRKQKEVECWRCKQKGHYRRNCPERATKNASTVNAEDTITPYPGQARSAEGNSDTNGAPSPMASTWASVPTGMHTVHMGPWRLLICPIRWLGRRCPAWATAFDTCSATSVVSASVAAALRRAGGGVGKPQNRATRIAGITGTPLAPAPVFSGLRSADGEFCAKGPVVVVPDGALPFDVLVGLDAMTSGRAGLAWGRGGAIELTYGGRRYLTAPDGPAALRETRALLRPAEPEARAEAAPPEPELGEVAPDCWATMAPLADEPALAPPKDESAGRALRLAAAYEAKCASGNAEPVPVPRVLYEPDKESWCPSRHTPASRPPPDDSLDAVWHKASIAEIEEMPEEWPLEERQWARGAAQALVREFGHIMATKPGPRFPGTFYADEVDPVNVALRTDAFDNLEKRKVSFRPPPKDPLARAAIEAWVREGVEGGRLIAVGDARLAGVQPMAVADLLAEKKTAVPTTTDHYRVVVDSRPQNAGTVGVRHPPPDQRKALRRLGQRAAKGKVDFYRYFLQARLAKSATPMAHIRAPDGQVYVMTVPPMGAKQMPSWFQAFGERNFEFGTPGDDFETRVVADDVGMGADRAKAFIAGARRVFEAVEAVGGTLDATKVFLLYRELEYLGWQLARGYAPTAERISGLRALAVPPETVREARSWLGAVGLVLGNVPGAVADVDALSACVDHATPARLATRRKVDWSEGARPALERVKARLLKPLWLMPPVAGKPLCAAADFAKGRGAVVVFQPAQWPLPETGSVEDRPAIDVMAVVSVRMTPTQAGRGSVHGELLTLAKGLTKVRHDVLGRPVFVATDCEKMISAFTAASQPRKSRIPKLVAQLAEFDLHFVHVPGVSLGALDFLSRYEPGGDATEPLPLDDPEEVELAPAELRERLVARLEAAVGGHAGALGAPTARCFALFRQPVAPVSPAARAARGAAGMAPQPGQPRWLQALRLSQGTARVAWRTAAESDETGEVAALRLAATPAPAPGGPAPLPLPVSMAGAAALRALDKESLEIFADDNGLLFLAPVGGNRATDARLYLPPALARQQARLAHEGAAAGAHRALIGTRRALLDCHWTPLADRAARHAVNACEICRLGAALPAMGAAASGDLERALERPLAADVAWQADSYSALGSRWLHAFDMFSGYNMFEPVADASAGESARALVALAGRHQRPLHLFLDGGPEFGGTFKQTADGLGIQRHPGVAYHPDSQARIERQHRVFNELLAKMSAAAQAIPAGQRCDALCTPQALVARATAAANAAPPASRVDAPSAFELYHCRKPHRDAIALIGTLPVFDDLMAASDDARARRIVTDHVLARAAAAELEEQRRKLRAERRAHVARHAREPARLHRAFAVGDTVRVFRPTGVGGEPAEKVAGRVRRWIGPYSIVELDTDRQEAVVELALPVLAGQERSARRRVHTSHLARWWTDSTPAPPGERTLPWAASGAVAAAMPAGNSQPGAAVWPSPAALAERARAQLPATVRRVLDSVAQRRAERQARIRAQAAAGQAKVDAAQAARRQAATKERARRVLERDQQLWAAEKRERRALARGRPSLADLAAGRAAPRAPDAMARVVAVHKGVSGGVDLVAGVTRQQRRVARARNVCSAAEEALVVAFAAAN